MTTGIKQHMYNERSRAMLSSVWANFVVSIYQNCNIESKLNSKGEL